VVFMLYSSSFFFFFFFSTHHENSVSHNACWALNYGLSALGEGKKSINVKNSSSAICGGEAQK